jgi:hypothetical protein
MESDGYIYYCRDCHSEWKHIDDYCPECGGENIEERKIDNGQRLLRKSN